MYRAGLGIEVDPDEAMRLLTRAAVQGHGGSRYTLAISYRDGYGVVADPERALYWMKEAAAARHPDAMRELALASATGDGVPIDLAAATEWAARAAIATRDIDLLVALIDVIDKARDADERPVNEERTGAEPRAGDGSVE
jgi:TPR repeat protein